VSNLKSVTLILSKLALAACNVQNFGCHVTVATSLFSKKFQETNENIISAIHSIHLVDIST